MCEQNQPPQGGVFLRNTSIFHISSIYSFCPTEKISIIRPSFSFFMIAHITDRQSPTLQEIKHSFSIDRREWTFSSGRLARLSPGSATISDNQGNVLLTTAGIGNAREGIDFFPLSVDFVEKYYASGKIGGNRFQRREGRPSEQAILTSRLIDRPIRPLFPDGTTSEVQIISTILSAASAGDFGFAGITGASLAILLSKTQGFE